MSIDENLDEKAVIEKIRERLRVSVGQAPLPPAQPRPEAAADASAESLQLELVTMRNEQDVSDAPFKSQRPWLGPLLVLANNIVRRLIAPSLERQVSYNTANRRLARAVVSEIQSLRRDNDALRRRCDALQAELDAVRAKLGAS
jgi:hypothetical protein